MRITLLNQFYPPDFAPTGRLAKSLAEHRVQAGDIVTVLSSSGGYVPQAPRTLHDTAGNPKIIRIWTPHLGKRRLFGRLIDYASYFLGALLLMSLRPRQDLIISMTTPPLIAWAALPHLLIHPSTSFVLWNMDCYPEIAEQTGAITPGGFLSRLLRQLNQIVFQRVDGVVCLDDSMRHLLLDNYSLNSARPKLTTIPTWEPAHRFPRDIAPLPWSTLDLAVPADSFVVLYMGNAGRGHTFETVLNLAQALQSEPIDFVFVGGGSAWETLKDACVERDLVNVFFRPYIPAELVGPVLAQASCGLITLRDSALGTISPSKVNAYLAMSLPLLYFGPAGSNVDAVINYYELGMSLRHGDVEEASSFLLNLLSSPSQLNDLRNRARRAFEESFSDEQVLPKFDAFIKSLL